MEVARLHYLCQFSPNSCTLFSIASCNQFIGKRRWSQVKKNFEKVKALLSYEADRSVLERWRRAKLALAVFLEKE